MPGGILQLVAKGMEDLFITGDPQVTIFKTVYRKYTNFSIEDKELKFRNKVGFGREFVCKIRNHGDLAHKMYIIFDLPSINLIFPELTRKLTISLLEECGITWNITNGLDEYLTDDDLIIIKELIISTMVSLIEQIFRIDTVEKLINGIIDTSINLTPEENEDLLPSEYLDLIILSLMQFDKLGFIYTFTRSFRVTYSEEEPCLFDKSDPFINSVTLQEDMFKRYRNNIIPRNRNPGPISDASSNLASMSQVITFHDNNFDFICNIEFGEFKLGVGQFGVNAYNFFQTKLDVLYASDLVNEYQNIDAFKLFLDYFNINSGQIINVQEDVEIIQNELLSFLKINLRKNTELLVNIYNSLTVDYKFIIFKKIGFVSIDGSGNITYDTSNQFENNSLNEHSDPLLDDEFSDKFSTTDLLTDPIHPYGTYTRSFINPLHSANKTLYNIALFDDYFSNLGIWEPIRLKNLVTPKGFTDGSGAGMIPTSLSDDIYHLTCMPFITAEDIVGAVSRYINVKMVVEDASYNVFLDSIIGLDASGSIPDPVDGSGTLTLKKDDIQLDFATNKYLLTDDDIDILEAMQGEYTDTSGDRFLTGYFRRIPFLDVDIVNTGDVSYKTDIMTFTIETLRRITIKAIDDYNINPSGNPLVSTTDRENILKIIGTFETETVPEFSAYKSNGYTIFTVPTGDVNPLRAFDTIDGPPRFVDAASSIWGAIYKNMINSYNNFYDKNVIKEEYFETNLGQEMSLYRRNANIVADLSSFTDMVGNINYYQTPSGNFMDTSSTLISKVPLYQNYLDRYEANISLINMQNIIIPQNVYYFEKFEIIHNFIENKIINDPTTYGYVDASGTGPSGNIVRQIIDQIKLELESVPTYGVMDWYNIDGVHDVSGTDVSGCLFSDVNYQLAFEQYWNFFNGDISGNEYPSPTALSEFRDAYNIPDLLGSIIEADEREIFNNTVGKFTASNLYTRLTEINNNYNGFKDEFSFYSFLMDEIVRASEFSGLLGLAAPTNEEIFENLENLLLSLRNSLELQLAKIVGNPRTLNDIVDSILGENTVGNVVDPNDNSIIIGTIDGTGIISNVDGSIFGQVSLTGLIINLSNIIVGSLTDDGIVLDIGSNIIGVVVLTSLSAPLSDIVRDDLLSVLDNVLLIVQETNSESLIQQIEARREPDTSARFAWIEKLGLYMIEKVSIFINGQLIDSHSGEWLYIHHETTKTKKKERGYNKMIGDIPRLTTYNKDGKMAYRMYVPLEFWYCRNVGSSLPLIALTHSDVELKVKLRSFEECAYFEKGAVFKPMPQLRASLLVQYIFIEPEERKRIVNSKHEYLIEQVQMEEGFEITREALEEDDVVRKRMYFKYPSKEILWTIQETSETDGSLPNGQLRWHKYTSLFNSNSSTGPSLFSLFFNGRERQMDKEGLYYNLVEPYKHHTSVPQDGIFSYSFALHPELLQPSGNANFSKIDNMDIVLDPNDETTTHIITNNTRFKWTAYSYTVNVLRIMSGLGGLAYFE